MSHEEEIVRNTYAKLSFLCSLSPLTKAANVQLGGGKVDLVNLAANVANVTPVYDLRNFETGTVASIASEPWSKFITQPQGEILQGHLATEYYSDSGNRTSWNTTEVAWAHSNVVNPEAAKLILAQPVSEIIKLGSPQWEDAMTSFAFPVTYTRYAAFTVDVTFQGKSSGQHNAIFFFGTDSHGKEFVAANDLVSSPSPIAYLANNRVDPSGLSLGKIRETPVVATWLRDNAMPASSCSITKQRDLCCSRGRCGFAPEALNRDLSTPLPAPKN